MNSSNSKRINRIVIENQLKLISAVISRTIISIDTENTKTIYTANLKPTHQTTTTIRTQCLLIASSSVVSLINKSLIYLPAWKTQHIKPNRLSILTLSADNNPLISVNNSNVPLNWNPSLALRIFDSISLPHTPQLVISFKVITILKANFLD